MLEYLAWMIAHRGSILGMRKNSVFPIASRMALEPNQPIQWAATAPHGQLVGLWSRHLDLEPGLKKDGAKGYLKRP